MVEPSMSLSSDSYVAILKGKRAELDAVSTLAVDRFVPLFEFMGTSKVLENLERAWASNNGQVVWAHVFNVDDVEDDAFAAELTELYAKLRSRFLAVPVLTPTEEPKVLAAIGAAAATDGLGAVLRIDVEDLVDDAVDSGADISSTIEGLGIPTSEVDLVLDAGLLTGSSTIQAAVAGQAIRALPTLTWRSVVLVFSAFPEALGDVAAKGSVTTLPRADAAAFLSVSRSIDRTLTYGDYAVGVPIYGGAPFTPIPSIRYTSESDWWIHRGTSRSNPSPQYRQLAHDVITAPYYCGTAFSAGDQQISDVATGSGGPGNATTHLRAAFSHHLQFVLNRLANLGEP